MMMVLANENLPASVIAGLRAAGHDVLWAKESLQGQPDDVILARAQLDGRLVLTQDKDFGELAFRFRLPAQCGVILFRLTGENPDADIARMLAVMNERLDWAGQFGVATDDRLRIRPLPKPST